MDAGPYGARCRGNNLFFRGIYLLRPQGWVITRCTTRYDIDLFKFVYCGFCEEACPTEGMQHLCQFTLGGTAAGTGVNAHPEFGPRVAALISSETGIDFVINPDPFEGIATQDAAVEMSRHLKTLAVSFMKIIHDLRWMNSSPLAGPGEITLPLLQPGSSICQSGLVYPDEHNLSALSYHPMY